MSANNNVIVAVIVLIAIGTIFFEMVPEKSMWSIPVKQEEGHVITVLGLGIYSVLLMHKQEEAIRNDRTITEEQKHHPNQQSHKRTRILIVDDDPDMTLTFSTVLKNNGFKEVDVYNDPLLALQNLKSGIYRLLITDLAMPKMDGFELSQRIKKIDGKIRVFFVTAFKINYEVLRGLFPSADDNGDISTVLGDTGEGGRFIQKPIEIQDFVKRVKAELQ
jgi:CheY-like chemotaxis protein